MGGHRKSTPQKTDVIGNIKLQTSAYGSPVPIRYGTNRGTGNLIWYGNFQAIAHTEKTRSGGKGGGHAKQTNTTYTYQASVMMSLGEGQISGIGAVWKGKEQTSLAALGLTLFSGAPGQAAWSFLSGYSNSTNWNAQEGRLGYRQVTGVDGSGNPTYTTAPFRSQALGYDSIAYVAAQAYDLGEDATIPNHGFEIIGKLVYGGSVKDCNPRDFISDFLTNVNYGVGMTLLGDWTQYSNYCVATGLFMSPQVEESAAASQYLQDWLDATNTDPLWSDGVLKLLPRGDETVTANGTTFTPNLVPRYDLAEDSYVAQDGPPVRLVRKTPADAFNRVSVEFCNRANQYNVEVVSVEDQNAVERYSLRPAPVISAHFITDAAIAKKVAQLYLQRQLYQRNEYEFSLTEAFALLEPGDLVTVTDPQASLSRVLVRILESEESDDGFDIRAEDMLVGVAAAAQYDHDSGLRYAANLTDPAGSVNTPHIFELPADPTTTGLSIGVATGGAPTDVLYGGCNVWMSMDGTSYQQIGTINGNSRTGTLAAPMTSGATSASVTLTNPGQMPAASAAQADNDITRFVVDQEYMAYETSSLTGALAYTLGALRRGRYGTSAASHSSGARFTRIDEGVCTIDNLDLTLIGKTVYFKFTSFNKYGGAEQALSAATAYSYTITGYMQVLGIKADLAQIGADGWLAPAEKQTVNQRYSQFSAEVAGLDSQATSLGVSRSAYDTAYLNLQTYLIGLSPAWNDTSQSTPIVRATWDSKWNTFYTARQGLLDAISAKIAGTTTAFNGQLNRLSTPVTPACANLVINHIQNPDGTVDIEFTWDWAGDENTIDGFELTYRQGDMNVGRVGRDTAGADFFGGLSLREQRRSQYSLD